MPAFWQGVSMINPILYMVNGFRYGILGVSDVNPFIALGMIVLFITIFSFVALRMLDRGKGIRS
jgi:ABC-2 type transport system permease protein